jgi:hypothetical protein
MAKLFRRFHQRVVSRPPARARLALEPLEDRAVPAPFTVTNLAPTDSGSLRQAILDANATAGPDTIVFQPGLSGTITLFGQLNITDSVSIEGPGASVISVSGNNAVPILLVNNFDATINVSISGLTLTQGKGSSGFAGAITVGDEVLALSGVVISGNTGGAGGGVLIAPRSRLTLENSTISGNTAITGGGLLLNNDTMTVVRNSTIVRNQATGLGAEGGGISILSNASLTLTNTTISGNNAPQGGGIWAQNAITTVEDSTISGNSATGDGGGNFLDGGAALIRNSTVAFNTANSDNANGGSGGGLFLKNGAAVTLQSAIVGDNIVGVTGAAADISGTVIATNSLIEDIAGPAFLAGSADNIFGADPLLGPLANNGGPTQTHALLSGSPAIDHGSNPFALATDQRGPGFPRLSGAGVDIGAFEVQLPPSGQGQPPSAPALQVAVQAIQLLRPASVPLAAFTFGDVSGGNVNDIVLAFRLRNHKLLLVTFDGVDGRIRGVFQPFTVPLRTDAKVRLLTVDVSPDPGAEIVLLVSGGGPGVPRLSVVTEIGAHVF